MWGEVKTIFRTQAQRRAVALAIVTLTFGVATAVARADDGATPPAVTAPEATVESAAPSNAPAGSAGAQGTPGSVTVTSLPETPAVDAPGPAAVEEQQPTVADTVPGPPSGASQDGTPTQDGGSVSEQSNTAGTAPEQQAPDPANEEPLVPPQPSLEGSQQQAAAASLSVQTDPLNGSVTILIGVAGNTAGTTQTNVADATANAGTTLVTEPAPETTTAALPTTPDGGNASTQNGQSSPTAGTGGVGQETPSTSPLATLETPGQGSSAGNNKGQKADATASAHQNGAKNKKVGVRVASPGDDGAVTQTNSASASATSVGTDDGSFVATSTAEATQFAPSNTNLDLRVASPGDNGAVTQTNTAIATATTSGTTAAATDIASATQIAPTNVNVIIRISSPGSDGTVTQANTATQAVTAAGPVSIGATTGGGNTNIAIALGDAGLVPPGASANWDWNWAWDSNDGQSGQPTPEELASQLATWQWSWGTPTETGPSNGTATSDTSLQGLAGGPASPGTGSDSQPLDGTWTWTWTWTWQQDDQTNWVWEWDWSQPCACSWNWNWNWDWSTPTGATTDTLPTLTDPTVAVPADSPAAGSPPPEALLAASALATLLGPMVQSNTSTATADAGSESHVSRITVALPDAPVTQTTAEDQAAQASATSTQDAPANVAVASVTGPGDPGPIAVAEDTVTQVNDVTATAAAVNLSDVTQTALQGQLTGEPVVVLPTVAQLVETRQVADASSIAEQSQVTNRVVIAGGIPVGPGGIPVGQGDAGTIVQQANTVTADASVANVSTVVQSIEQAQAAGGDGVQASAEFASVAQAGLASIEASQLGSVNATHFGQAGLPLTVSTQPAAPVVPSTTIVTQVSQAAADASAANESEIDQLSAQLQVASPSSEGATSAAAVEQAATATADAKQASTSNLVVLPTRPAQQTTSAPTDSPADLVVVQQNLASAVSASANTSFVSQESVQSQSGAEASTADSAQVAIVTQQAEAHAEAAQTAVGSVADDSTLEPFGFFGQGNGAFADVSAGNASAVGQSVAQEQIDTTGATTEARNETSVDQSNSAQASASMTSVVNTGLYVDGLAIIDATSEATALDISLVVQEIDQSQEIIPPEPPKPVPPPGGGGSGDDDNGHGTGQEGGGGTGQVGGGDGDLGSQGAGTTRGGRETGRGSTMSGSGGAAPGSDTGAFYVVKEFVRQSAASGGSGGDAAATRPAGSGDEFPATGAFEPGPDSTEIYLSTNGATGGPDASSSLLLPTSMTSVIVVDADGVWINGVRTALGAQTEPEGETTVEARVERGHGPAAPADDTSPRGPPVVTATSGAGPAPGSAGGGITAALAARASPISPDGGEIQDPPTLLEPPGAVVTLLDTPG